MSWSFCYPYRPSVPGVAVRIVVGGHLRVQQGGALYTSGTVTVRAYPRFHSSSFGTKSSRDVNPCHASCGTYRSVPQDLHLHAI